MRYLSEITKEPIYWNESGRTVRAAVCELCGWATRTSKRIARLDWENLSPAARRVLSNHGIQS